MDSIYMFGVEIEGLSDDEKFEIFKKTLDSSLTAIEDEKSSNKLYVGKEILKMRSKETYSEFKNNTKHEIKRVLGLDLECKLIEF